VSLRTKLLLAQIPLGLALAAVGGMSVYTVDALGQSSQAILADNYRSVLAAQRMKESIERLDSAALFLVAGERERALEQAHKNRPRFEEELAVEERNITEEGEHTAALRLRQGWAAYQRAFDRFVDAAPEGNLASLYFTDLEPAFDAVKRDAETILNLNQDAMLHKSDAAFADATQMNQVMSLVSLVALVAGFGASTVLTSRLLRPLDGLANAARRLGDGDTEVRAPVHTDDEIGALGREFNEMAERVSQYRQSTLGDLLQAQETSQAAIDSLPDAVVVFDAQRNVTTLNEAAEKLLDAWHVPPGESPLVRAAPEVRALCERVVDHVLGGRGSYVPRGFEEAVRAPGGAAGDAYLMVRASPLYVNGAVGGVTVILQDVTRLRRFDELRNDLVATVAHEFRTPLTSLRMAIHLCLEGAAGPVTAKQAELLHAGRDDCERLQRIVDDLLDLARLQSGKVDLARRPMTPGSLVGEAREAHVAEARQRGVELANELIVDLPAVLADPERIELVLSNLITNALRFTPSGERVELGAHLGDGGTIRFEVRDHGPGVAAELRERIFDRFFRAPGAPAGGSGLGLSIAKEIVEAHGGQIGVEDAEGGGACFWFTLPIDGTGSA
jgi:NtrC-family two-component system sensor histidine kinase KinB